jgi:TonB-dependent starch-binding outer membrane protein SusC
VVVRGAAICTATDEDGKYTIVVPEKNAVLVYSFTGMKPRAVKVGESNNIDVVLEADILNVEGDVITAIAILTILVVKLPE